MANLIDLTGGKYNKLLVVQKAASRSTSGAYWECKCDCGKTTIVSSGKLKNGLTKSCGCHRTMVFTNASHGHANKTQTYKTWKQMRWRCNPKNKEKYPWYGDVKVCARWDNFEHFLNDMGERPDGMTIDRINPFGDYEPTNCRWATQKEQMNNTRKQHA